MPEDKLLKPKNPADNIYLYWEKIQEEWQNDAWIT